MVNGRYERPDGSQDERGISSLQREVSMGRQTRGERITIRERNPRKDGCETGGLTYIVVEDVEASIPAYDVQERGSSVKASEACVDPQIIRRNADGHSK